VPRDDQQRDTDEPAQRQVLQYSQQDHAEASDTDDVQAKRSVVRIEGVKEIVDPCFCEDQQQAVPDPYPGILRFAPLPSFDVQLNAREQECRRREEMRAEPGKEQGQVGLRHVDRRGIPAVEKKPGMIQYSQG